MNVTNKTSTELINITEALGHTFTLNNKPIERELVFSPTGYLPAFGARARELLDEYQDSRLNEGITFDEDDSASLGVIIEIDLPSTQVAIMLFTYVLFDMLKAHAGQRGIPIDELLFL